MADAQSSDPIRCRVPPQLAAAGAIADRLRMAAGRS